jgi:protein-S-isoprenylcysteine O-methyltransferase Ste14
MRIPIPAIVVPMVVFLLYLFVPGVKEQPWTALRIIGAILAVVGYVLLITARMQLGKSFSVIPQAKALITHGLYSRIRNPIYLFVDVMWFGWSSLSIFTGYLCHYSLCLHSMCFGRNEKERCCKRRSDKPTSIIESEPGVDPWNAGRAPFFETAQDVDESGLA